MAHNGQVCSKCKLWKSAEHFWKQAGRPSGLHNYCKDCGKKRYQEYRKTHSGEIYETQLQWNKRHPEKVKLYRNHADYRRGRTTRLIKEKTNDATHSN